MFPTLPIIYGIATDPKTYIDVITINIIVSIGGLPIL